MTGCLNILFYTKFNIMDKNQGDYRKILLEDFRDDYSMYYVEYDGRKETLNCYDISDCILLGMMNQERGNMDMFDMFDAYEIYKRLPINELIRDILPIFSVGDLVSTSIKRDERGTFRGIDIKVSEDKILKIWK